MSITEAQPNILPSTTAPLPAPCATARKRGRTITKELVGKALKCKLCQSKDAYVSVKEGRYFVSCPDCNANYYLKEQHL